jgi:hypothetical protein
MAFEPVRKIAAIMQSFEKPWFVAGGWAVDLFLGRETRTHEDIEVSIFRRDQETIWRHLSAWEGGNVQAGTRRPWRGEWLPPPIHEIHAKRGEENLREIEVLLDEAWADTWRFRRNLAVMRPTADIGLRNPEGVPFLAPEIVLLYKAKDPRPQDEADFRATLPALDANRRQRLADALRTCHPGHAWLDALAAPPESG